MGSTIILSGVQPGINSDNEIDSTQVTLEISHPETFDGVASAIGFSTGGGVSNVGAAILHERTGANSQGKLHFASRTDTANTGPTIHMTIDDRGNVGIGTRTPSADLDVYGGTGVIRYTAANPADWADVVAGPT